MKKNFVFIMLVVSLVFNAVEAFGQTTLSGTYTSDNKSNITFTGKNFILVVESNNNSKFGVFSSLPRKGTFSISGSSLTLNISTYDDDPIIEKWTIINANTLKDNRNIVYVKEGTSSNTTSQPAAPPANSRDFEMNGTTLVKYKGNATNVTIPSGVTAIGEKAFYDNTTITVVTIPSSVTSIGNQAFRFCYRLVSITIPSSVTSIGESAFDSCTDITNITIPASVKIIGNKAFHDCRSLTSITVDTQNNAYSSTEGVLFNKNKTILIQYPSGKKETSYTIPASVTTIGENSFSWNSYITNITILSSVTTIKDNAFASCRDLANITVDTQNSAYSSMEGVLFNKNKTVLILYPKSKQGTNYTIPSSVTSIMNEAFIGNTKITSVTLPSGVTSIGKLAFAFCDKITSITIPSNVTSIADEAFSHCASLTRIIIPSSVTSLGYQAFSYCDSLASITIPSSVTSVGDLAFFGCDNLKTVTLSRKAKIGKDAFPSSAKITYSD